MTILDAFSVFKNEVLLANDRSQSYIDGFWWMVRSFTDVAGNIDTEDITLEVYTEWRRYMHDRHRMNTIHTNVSRFKVFADWLVEQGWSSIPMDKVKAPKRPKPNPTYLTAGEIDKMVAAATNIRDKAIIDVLFSCGVRSNECREMRKNDIIDSEVHVQHGVKGDDNRQVRLSKRARTHLQMYLQSRVDSSAYLFVTRTGKKIAGSTFRYIVKNVGKRAGIDPAKCHPHAARHGCGTHLMEGGMHMRAIQDYLGHAFITTTQIYTHPERENVRVKHAEIFDGEFAEDPRVLRQQIMELQQKLKVKSMPLNRRSISQHAGV
jgi:site-specific recombinase XerD